ncbi:MAG: triose-phosphate isomerase [Lachnospiraceae bacterium]|nr:triose-phosphate isomerase [Lachnospiraceae bacterium]
MRKKIIAGNWKMNMTPTETKELIAKLKSGCDVKDADVVFVVPSIDVTTAKASLEGSNIKLGTQNFYFEDKGAFTGEISAKMILDAGAEYVIIGHSERRMIFKEDDKMINLKLKKAHEAGLKPILCCGESLELREAGTYKTFIEGQIKSAFDGISDSDAKKTVVAYEPIWAIGTGKTATSEEAEEVCKFIRECLSKIYSKDVSEEIRIQYGGSVNAGNVKELFGMPDIDGGLVGGASLKEDFIKIVNYKE